MKSPLTRSGRMVAWLVVVAYPLGWWLGWVEFMVIAAASLLSLAVAALFVVGRQSLTVTRQISPSRVQVGQPAVDVVTVANDGAATVRAGRVEERIADDFYPIEVGALAPGAELMRAIPLPTTRRGRYPIGPSVVTKSDPLGLMRREVVQLGSSRLWVHPLVVPVSPVPIGYAKDLEGPTTDASPAGDVSFHAIREYTEGDDPRHVHWLSTAKAGTLMIKHYVDNRRPQVALVMDSRADSYPADEFETVVSAAASVGVASLISDQPASIFLGPDPVMASSRPMGIEPLLDALTLATPSGELDLMTQAMMALKREPEASVLVLATGPLGVEELLGAVEALRRQVHVIIVRFWSGSEMELASLPGATVLDADSPERFSRVWEQAVSRA